MGTNVNINRTRNADRGVTVAALDIYDSESTQSHRLGAKLILGDRVFRYANISGLAASKPGMVYVGSSYVLTASTKTAHPAGTIVLTLSGATISVNDYAEGYLVFSNTAGAMGAGSTYKIKENSSSVASNFTVTLYDAIASACTTATTALCVSSLYNDILIAPLARTHTPVGVPLVEATAGYYQWVQTWGPCGVVVGSAVGDTATTRIVAVNAVTAGSVRASTSLNEITIGYCYTNAVTSGSGIAYPIVLTIAD